MWTVEFWKATAERVLSTFAQALLGAVGATSAEGVDWGLSLKVAGFAALLALLKCLAASGIGNKGPSLANEVLTGAVAAAEAPAQVQADTGAPFVAGPAAVQPEGTPVTVDSVPAGDTKLAAAMHDPGKDPWVDPLDGANEDYEGRHEA